MKFTFLIFKYFPYGGVQRDMLRIAEDCISLGHEVTVYTGQWRGDLPQEGIKVEVLPTKGLFNHQRHQKLINQMNKAIEQNPVDLVVGFNRIPNLDVYFAADPCFLERSHTDRPWWYKYTPRFKWFYAAEKSIFRKDGACHILTLTEAEQSNFQRWYKTPNHRFHPIPPFISAQRFAKVSQLTKAQRLKIRREIRSTFGFGLDEKVMLMVGSGFKTKGADRAVLALKDLPLDIQLKTRLVIVGQDAAQNLKKLISDLNLMERVKVFPGRDDIPILMAGSDLLIHPARYELAGHVLLEAMVAGLPVLVSDVCGYAAHVRQAQAGIVVGGNPFNQIDLNKALVTMLSSSLTTWSENGKRYTSQLMNSTLSKFEANLLVSLAKKKSAKGEYV